MNKKNIKIEKEIDKKLLNDPDFINYLSIRELHDKVMKPMVYHFLSNETYYQNQLITKINKRKNNLGKSKMTNFDLDQQDYQKLALCFIYPNNMEIEAISEKFIKENRFKSFEEMLMLKAICKARFGIYKIIENDYEHAKLLIEDEITNKRYQVIDQKLSLSIYLTNKTNVYLCLFLITYQNINIFDDGVILDINEGTPAYDDLFELINKIKNQLFMSTFDIVINLLTIKNDIKKEKE